MSKEYTEEEVLEEVRAHIRTMINYWATVQLDRPSKDTLEYRLEGLSHSLMSMFDGCAADLPGFIVAPRPHEDDKQYHIDNNENYYPENHESNINCDIGGSLRYFRK